MIYLLSLLYRALLGVLEIALYVGICILASLGIFPLLDFVQADPTAMKPPTVVRLYPSVENVQKCFTSPAVDPDDPWEGYQDALWLLDRTCPEVSRWVRERHERGELVWDHETSTRPRYAALETTLTGKRILFINDLCHCQHNAGRARTLAHEYRHAQQTWCQHILSVFQQLTRPGSEGCIEPEAYWFDHIVGQALEY